MGRRFNDDDILRSAIGQYEFLRREYPGSQGRFDALFTIGEIYQDDLNDPVPRPGRIPGISSPLSPASSGGGSAPAARPARAAGGESQRRCR